MELTGISERFYVKSIGARSLGGVQLVPVKGVRIMKTKALLLLIIIAYIAVGCSSHRVDSNKTRAQELESAYSEKIGKQIPEGTCKAWVVKSDIIEKKELKK
jgi:hypothetical protein